jgi:thymidine kinase
MTGGKSSYLFDKYRQYSRRTGIRMLVVKPIIDTRADGSISTHWGGQIPALTAAALMAINVKEYDIILIDEAHWFPDLYQFIAANMDKIHARIYIAGLNGDKNQQKFGQVLDIIPFCSHIEWKPAICEKCGDIAGFSECRIQTSEINMPGGADLYYNSCSKHLSQNNK